MSRFSLKMINYRMAVISNMPLFLLPLLVLIFWQQGAYSKSNDDGFGSDWIVGLIVGLSLLVVLALSILFLALAKKEQKKVSTNSDTIVSGIYGISTSIGLGYWLLVTEATW